MDCLSVLFSLINNVKPGPEQSGRPFRQMSDHFSEASYHNQKLLIFVSLMKLILTFDIGCTEIDIDTEIVMKLIVYIAALGRL